MPSAPPAAEEVAITRAFRRLAGEAGACRACPAICPGSAVLGAHNGPIPCDWLFVGEAPGRLGAARTGIPFDGDEAGRRFTLLLAEAGLHRDQVFVTNAVLCLPLDGGKRNRRPSAAEVANCASFLARTIALVQPTVVVAMGAVALAALGRIEPHGLRLSHASGRPASWLGRTLVPVYHPGRRAELHRLWDPQVADWRALPALASRTRT